MNMDIIKNQCQLIHFASCYIGSLLEEEFCDGRNACPLISGYTKEVNWSPSTGFELELMENLAQMLEAEEEIDKYTLLKLGKTNSLKRVDAKNKFVIF